MGLLHCHHVQRVAEAWVVYLVEDDIHVSLAQSVSINPILHLKHIQSHLLRLLKELFFLLLEKLRN
jgi:hypothetical protein